MGATGELLLLHTTDLPLEVQLKLKDARHCPAPDLSPVAATNGRPLHMLLSGLHLKRHLCLPLQATAKLDDARKKKLDEMFQQAVSGGGTSATAAVKGGVTATSSASSSPGIKRGVSMPVSAWALAVQVFAVGLLP